MRPQLRDMTDLVIKEFIHQHVEEAGGKGVVIGLSGGIDSAVVSLLCADAIGPEKVLNIFMPTTISPEEDLEDAQEFSRKFGMEFKIVDITPALEGLKEVLPELRDRRLLGNAMARERMIILFHHAKCLDRLVMGTSNKSELLVGYFTKFGDGGADFCPIGDIYKTEVRELAEKIGVPQKIIDKAPTAGLWKGQTDEGELGVSYDELDQILFGFENGLTTEEVTRRTGIAEKTVEKVWRMHRSTVHKRKMPLIPKVGVRTLGLDWRE